MKTAEWGGEGVPQGSCFENPHKNFKTTPSKDSLNKA